MPLSKIEQVGGSDILYHLNQNGIAPPRIVGAGVNIQNVSSNYSSHIPEQALHIADYPGTNSIIGLKVGFLELMAWMNKLLQ